MSGPRLTEDELIATCFAPLAGPGGLRLLDDAALITPPADEEIVVTTDALVAGVHFFGDDPPGAIAKKALRVNLSDLAAKGAEPLGFVISLALAPEWEIEWLAAFAGGLGEDAHAYSCPLLGGDTVKTPGPLTLSITALGSVPKGRMAPRTGVQAGDRIYVSGTIGDAAIGLKLRLAEAADAPWRAGLGEQDRAFLLDRFLLPQPRMALRAAMRANARAGMDVSDGLIGDLSKMLKVSGVSATIELARVPLSPSAEAAVRASPDLFEVAVTGGDDYEVLASVDPEAAAAFEAQAQAAGVRVTAIGTAGGRAGQPPVFLDSRGEPRQFARGSFSHF